MTAKNPDCEAELADILAVLQSARKGGDARMSLHKSGAAGRVADLLNDILDDHERLQDEMERVSKVLTAVKKGDFSARVPIHRSALGLSRAVGEDLNEIVELNERMAGEFRRISLLVGKEGKINQRASIGEVSGSWKNTVASVNSLIADLVQPTNEVARVIGAVARGDLSQTMALEVDGRPVKGEFLRIAKVVNTMVDQLGSFASEVTRVAREVGTEGKLGGQAHVKGVAGTWKDLTDNVNSMAGNLTSQVRGIASVVTAVANGDLDRKLMLEVKGEIAALADTINGMIDTLATFADQVTSVAREVGVEGKLGGQAKVPNASGTWRGLTDNVNQLAANLTTQVRAIAEVATAVTKGDLTRSIAVEAQGEVAALKDNINEMIRNLKDTTHKNTEQDWLKTNLAKFSRMLQGQRDLVNVSKQIFSELAPLVSVQYGALYLVEQADGEASLRLVGSYAGTNLVERFKIGEGLIGQCAAEKRRILLTEAPGDYIQVSSALGKAVPSNIVILPVLFEGDVNAVIELASFERFSGTHLNFLDQLTVSIGLVLNTIAVNSRTEDLLKQSQSLTQGLQRQQIELKETNEQLEEKARLLSEQKEEIERKNNEVELAKKALEEKADQLALTSKYKSQFLANMSHELRTPLNSLLILAKMLYQNSEGNLTARQIDFAKTVHSSGSDLLALINEILDMSKIESGMITVEIGDLDLAELSDYVDRNFRQIAQDRGLEFNLELSPNLAKVMRTDSKRLQQILKNLLSNAFKFTEKGSVSLRVGPAAAGVIYDNPVLQGAETVLAFSVKDTGIGVPLDKQKIIFEAFQQADMTTSRKYGGTGLGLTISREIARLLGGEIHVHAAPGEGSTFTLYLPANYVPQAPGSNAPEGQTRAHVIHAEPRPEDRTPLPHVDRMEVVEEIPDDRDAVAPGDRVLLIVEDDPAFARILVDQARGEGMKALVAQRGEAALALVRKFKPDAITLDIRLPDMDGWRILDMLKHEPSTRHIPVQVISADAESQRGLKVGALACLSKPVTPEGLSTAIGEIKTFIDRRVKELLIVEDDDVQRTSIVELTRAEDIESTAVATGKEALEVLAKKKFDCMIVDLGLSDMTGTALLETIAKDESLRRLPIIVYTGKDLGHREKAKLKKLAKSIIIKDAGSPELLLDETSLYLHRKEAGMTDDKRRMIERLRLEDPSLAGKKVLIVDDDVRNIFALTSLLEQHGVKVPYAESGKGAIELLKSDPEIDLVLMDVMMPDMDGYDTMRAIRKIDKFKSLPIISLTAKAMKGDREKCLEAGASDYIAKPVDIPQLLSMLRVWMYK